MITTPCWRSTVRVGSVLLGSALCVVLTVGCSSSKEEPSSSAQETSHTSTPNVRDHVPISAEVKNKSGDVLGLVLVSSLNGKTHIQGVVKGLAPGRHSVHLHVSHCVGSDFSKAQGHLGPLIDEDKGIMSGDVIDPVVVDSGGRVILGEVTAGSVDVAALKGKGSLIIHGLVIPSTGASDPTDREACANL